MREDRGGDTERNGGGEGREESRVVGLFLLPSLPFSAFASEEEAKGTTTTVTCLFTESRSGESISFSRF